MFSIYEQIQLAAIPGINTTIKDKYFTSASTTPARIFPILGDLAAKHMRKAWKSKGLKVKLDKALGELTGRVGDRYPSRLSLEERGAFQLGYYFIIPYGLYRMNGYISAKLAQNVTGFCDEDLDVLWQAILNMFEFDRSAARGNMAVRKLYVFKHSSALGDAPSWKLFDSINVHKRAEVDVPRDFADYEVRVNREAIPESVSLTEMVDHAL